MDLKQLTSMIDSWWECSHRVTHPAQSPSPAPALVFFYCREALKPQNIVDILGAMKKKRGKGKGISPDRDGNRKKLILSRDWVVQRINRCYYEGSFQFKPQSVHSFSWSFSITLHIDDVEVLNYIHNILGVGAVYLSKKYPRASLEVCSQEGLLIILAIFARCNLNSTKHLNYLAFGEAFILYTKDKSREYWNKLKPILLDILSSMNSKRTKLDLTASHKILITSNWLLGFVEGDGSFSYARGNVRLNFSITQKDNDPLLNAIKDFLLNLAKEYRTVNNLERQLLNENAINIYNYPEGISLLQVSRSDFLEHILIPLFNSLTFHTKKNI